MRIFFLTRSFAVAAALIGMAVPHGAQAAGDLLVAPTRVVLNGSRGTEVILNNIGSETATYRITLELRRMTKVGKLQEVARADANEKESSTLSMIRYAPRRVTLPPNQPQAIRLGVRTPADLPDGEYRAHLLFRAIPKVQSNVEQKAPETGFSIALTPIYGVTIPVIVRKGNLKATAAIANVRLETTKNGPALLFDLSRAGEGSTYGEIRVRKAGVSDPLVMARGIAVYDEVTERTVSIPLPKTVADELPGPATIEYFAPASSGGGLIARSQVNIITN